MAGLALVAAQSVAHLVVTLGANLDFGQSDSAFDLDRSNGIPDIVSTLVIVAAAAGATVQEIRFLNSHQARAEFSNTSW